MRSALEGPGPKSVPPYADGARRPRTAPQALRTQQKANAVSVWKCCWFTHLRSARCVGGGLQLWTAQPPLAEWIRR
eukprot:350601-Chlamydomonas_euryale.AAC.1